MRVRRAVHRIDVAGKRGDFARLGIAVSIVHALVQIENRREAIRYALKFAQPSDVIVLAGKGHETYQEICGVRHPFDEKIVVAELLREMEEE